MENKILKYSQINEKKDTRFFIAIGKYALGLHSEKNWEKFVENCKFYIKSYKTISEKNAYLEGVSNATMNGDYVLISAEEYYYLRNQYITSGSFLI